MGKTVATCVLALVCGALGATGSVAALHAQLRGEQGATGLTGAPGPQGADGRDGVDGTDGVRGPAGRDGKRGRAGRAGKPATDVAMPTDLGLGNCAGRSMRVITDAKVDPRSHRLQLVKQTVCIVKPAGGTAATPTAAN